jgi:hypothetical protein
MNLYHHLMTFIRMALCEALIDVLKSHPSLADCELRIRHCLRKHTACKLVCELGETSLSNPAEPSSLCMRRR